MKRRVLLSLFSILFSASPLLAEGLSQIDFDGRSPSEQVDKPKPEAKLIDSKPQAEAPKQESSSATVISSVSDLKAQVEAAKSVEAQSHDAILAAAARRAAPRARLKPVAWPKGVVGNRFITPSLRGVLADPGKPHKNWVTSEYSWKKKGRKSCGEPRNEAEMLSKSLAVREVLFRFSGSDEFASSQCKADCKKDAYANQLAGVSFNTLKGGSFQFVDHKGECRYRLAKHPKKKWEVLQPSRVSCVCLPAN